MRSTVIGTTIGIIPGVGQVVAAFVGYAAAKNASKHPERFGKGELEGCGGSGSGQQRRQRSDPGADAHFRYSRR